MKISKSPPPKKKYHIMHALHICFAFTLFLIEKIQYKSELNSTPMSEHVLQHFNLNDFLISSHKIWRAAYAWCCNTPIFLPYRLNTPLVEIPQAPGSCWEVEGVDVRKDHSACATLTSGDGEVWEAGNRWFCEEGAAETALLKRGSWEGLGGGGGSVRARGRGEEGTCYPPCSPPLWSAVRSSPPCLFSADLSCRLLYLGAASFPHLSLMLALPAAASLPLPLTL